MMRSRVGCAELQLLVERSGGDVPQAVACSHPWAQPGWHAESGSSLMTGKEGRQATLQEELLPVLNLKGQIGISKLKRATLFSSRNTSEDCTLTRIECEIF